MKLKDVRIGHRYVFNHCARLYPISRVTISQILDIRGRNIPEHLVSLRCEFGTVFADELTPCEIVPWVPPDDKTPIGYRSLKAGDVIQEGDEIFNPFSGKWIPEGPYGYQIRTTTIGYKYWRRPIFATITNQTNQTK